MSFIEVWSFFNICMPEIVVILTPSLPSHFFFFYKFCAWLVCLGSMKQLWYLIILVYLPFLILFANLLVCELDNDRNKFIKGFVLSITYHLLQNSFNSKEAFFPECSGFIWLYSIDPMIFTTAYPGISQSNFKAVSMKHLITLWNFSFLQKTIWRTVSLHVMNWRLLWET